MKEERKPIGYLMGKPIYEADLEIEEDEPMTVFMQSWKQFVEQKVANSFPPPKPKEDLKC